MFTISMVTTVPIAHKLNTHLLHADMSVSLTHTFQKKHEGRRGFRQQRTYDYLYDPVYTLSADVDHARENFRAQASMDRVRKVPEFNSMFSNLPHHPRFTLRLEATEPVPVFIDRRWRGLAEQKRQALQQLTGVVSQMHRPNHTDVTGMDRWKFFKCPLIPFAQQIPPDVVFALPKSDLLSASDGDEKRSPTPFQRSVGVQTDYRESETQTDPFTPDYAVRPGTAPPELLTLATLTWGRGLPAGLAEVEMIERARMKRAWEATLPPLNDLSQLDKRRRMMEEMERKEWAFREKEIEKLQEARLTLLVQLLRQREEKQEEVKMDRLDVSFSQHQQEKEAQIKKIRNDYIISMRKLLAKRRNVEGKLKRRDIIKDYSDYGFQTYAPRSRIGQISDRNSNRNVVKSHFLSTYEGLLELEAGLSPSVMEPQIKVPRPKVTKGFITRSARRELELMKTHQALREEKGHVVEKKPLRFLFKREKPAPRPPTPAVEDPPEGDEERELAVIFLQKVLRGRSTQNQVFEGKEKRLELIQELRTTHALQKEEQNKKEAEKQVTLALQRQRDTQSETVSQIESYISGLSGGVIVDMLDFLSKELLRLQEERRIHAFSLLAERDRRIREAEESGRRQIEERRRREEDEIFKQVVKMHQDTVDMYLEDVILGCINQTADAQAREEVHRKAEELNNVTYAMEETMNSQQSEEIVAELVYRFLIPEVQKIAVRERVHQSQRRHLQAARSIIRSSPGSSAVSQPPSPSDRASSLVLNDILSQVEDAVPRTVTPRDPGPARNNQTSDPTADASNGNGKHAD
ncbi:cilia- and flagella-associated protein 91 [Cyprinus carpio]|uniref:Cilia- and flagella-associated protein 91 n=1 Tax=Cyprinus carpio TaxID=7962 RepID=A0A9Q9VDX1_CYPCA|nr:cilia- and flagella-associated protein 91 [Cyprinus carpio]